MYTLFYVHFPEIMATFAPPETSLTSIAAAVGLSLQNLRLLFKKRYGITPTDYRQRKQNL